MFWLRVTLRGAGGEVRKADMPLYPTTLQEHSNNMYGLELEFRFSIATAFKSSLKVCRLGKSPKSAKPYPAGGPKAKVSRKQPKLPQNTKRNNDA